MKVSNDNSIYQLEGHNHPLVRLRTKQGYNVLFTEIDNAGSYNERDLLPLANNFSKLKRKQDKEYSKIHFPMVHLDCKVDISWLVGMAAAGEVGAFYISQAKKQVILKVNDKGARAKSAVALEIRSRPTKPIYTVNGPFLLWFEKDKLSNSPFAALCGWDCWKNPGDLT